MDNTAHQPTVIMTAKLIDRAARVAGLPGLLGLLGVAGVFSPRLAAFSFLSFFSYLGYFRFLVWFTKPPRNSAQSLVPLLGIVPAIFLPWLGSMSPWFGFIGFAGFCGLCDPPTHSQQDEAA